jgi:uncharacterized protein (TIGR02302 family)
MTTPGHGRRRALLVLAAGVLFWERLWPRLWPVLGVGGLFLALALSDALPLLPAWLHVTVLVAFAIALLIAMLAGARALGGVDTVAARRRLERDSGLHHRPLTAIEDRLIAGATNPMATALWRVHVERAARASRDLRVGLPAPGMARRDPHGLRAVVVLILAAAAIGAHGDAYGRLERALVPGFGQRIAAKVGVDVWITPPAYTGRAALFVDHASRPAEPLAVPAGSTVLAQASGAEAPPRLYVGARIVPFVAMAANGESGDFRVETTIEDGPRLAVEVDGRELAAWPLRVIADAPPTVEFTKPPAANSRAHLKLAYEAHDDYGVADIVVEIRRVDGRALADRTTHVRLSLAAPRAGSTLARGQALRDLTGHPWAGLPVILRLHATDARGQPGEGAEVRMVLPERIFRHPVARAIIEQRKRLAVPTPSVRAQVIGALLTIAAAPQLFAHDSVVFLALVVARSRLVNNGNNKSVASIRQLLWDTALRLEEGETAIAERTLRRAQERLMKALEQGSGNDEIERLINELKRALDAYLSALAGRLPRPGTMDPAISPDTRMFSRDGLQDIIERARALARSGAVDAARRLLSELQRAVDDLGAARKGATASKESAEARKLMDTLRDLRRRQRELLDRTFRRWRGSGPQPGKFGDPNADAAEQEALRRRLGDAMIGADKLLGAIPPGLGRAERNMNDATGEMSLGQTGDAVEAQTEAIENLRDATNYLSERLARRFGGVIGIAPGRPGTPGAQGRDPFGRLGESTSGSAGDDDSVTIPGPMELRRAREILRELRRRSGETARPRPERDYIERLLRRFE